MADESTEAEVIEFLNTFPWQERRALKQCYPKGNQMPSGYVDAQDWAVAQLLHGLRQKRCEHGCSLLLFPQEVSGHVCKPMRQKRRAASQEGKP